MTIVQKSFICNSNTCYEKPVPNWEDKPAKLCHLPEASISTWAGISPFLSPTQVINLWTSPCDFSVQLSDRCGAVGEQGGVCCGKIQVLEQRRTCTFLFHGYWKPAGLSKSAHICDTPKQEVMGALVEVFKYFVWNWLHAGVSCFSVEAWKSTI